ncbi:MAG: hypothetical protein ACJAXX_000246 [Roseivirga sp.]
MEEQTVGEYKQVIEACKDIFFNKTKDYGTAWRILRLPSITDQIFIKAKRIQSIQNKGNQKVEDGITGEFIGIINYCIIALIQMELSANDPLELDVEKLQPLYDQKVEATFNLLMDKNHDYGEAWRDMRVSSMTDIILMKLLRVKQIEDNQGVTIISEGIDANYQDMINYSIFCLILMGFAK